MANVRIRNLPAEATPNKNDLVPLDNATTRAATIEAIVNIGRPFASQAEAEAGVATNVGMNPLTTKQAFAAQGALIFQPFSPVLSATTASFTTADRTKLDGVAVGATANSADATLLSRANHTGTQSADSITDGVTNAAFLADERTKLAGIEAGANVTNSVSVAAAGAVMASAITDNNDLAVDGNNLPLRKNVKAYVDANAGGIADGAVTNTKLAAMASATVKGRATAGSGTPEDLTMGQLTTLLLASTSIREVLTANRTYYVRTDGNDLNTGLTNTAGGAFKTLEKARSTLYGLDLNGFAVTVQIADGTYTTGVAHSGMPAGATHTTPITYRGNPASPANVVILVGANHCFSATLGAIIAVTGLEMRTTVGNCLWATRGGQITYGQVNFGACAAFHKEANDHGRIYNSGNYAILWGAVAHEHCTGNSYILSLSCMVTLSNGPAFSSYFAGSALSGTMQYVGVTYTGAASGPRYLVHKNSVIDTNGGGANFFPGTVAGVVATGAQYI